MSLMMTTNYSLEYFLPFKIFPHPQKLASQDDEEFARKIANLDKNNYEEASPVLPEMPLFDLSALDSVAVITSLTNQQP